MANPIKWQSGLTDRGTVLSTELNGLANNTRTNAGSEIDNTTNLDQWGLLQLDVQFSSAPASNAFVAIYAIKAPDGTNYEDGSSSVAPSTNTLVATIPVRSAAVAQKLTSQLFRLPATKIKFILENQTGVAFPSSGSTLKLFTVNEEIK